MFRMIIADVAVFENLNAIINDIIGHIIDLIEALRPHRGLIDRWPHCGLIDIISSLDNNLLFKLE